MIDAGYAMDYCLLFFWLLVLGVSIFSFLMILGPPKSMWCDRENMHEWTGWVQRDGGNERKCTKCGYTERNEI
jgi:hypothetical protein